MLTPEEVTARRFLVSLRGYDRDEVHAFLDQVADDLRVAQSRIAELEGESKTAPAPVAERSERAATDASAGFAGIGRETERILEAAHAAAAEIVQRAQEEADRSLTEVRQQISDELADGQRRLNAVEESLNGLAASRSEVAGELRDIQRTIEHVLRELVPEDEHTVSVREALAAQARAQLRQPSQEMVGSVVAGPDLDRQLETETSAEQPSGEPAAAPAEESTAGVEPLREALDEDEPQPPAEPELGDETSTTEVGDGEQPAQPAPDVAPHEDAGALRSEVLGPLHPRMSRSVKRGLQDLHNRLLSVVGGPDELGDAEQVVFQPEDLDGLADLVDEELQRAYRAGVDAAHVLADDAASAPATARSLANEFARHAAERCRSPVAATLRLGLSAGESTDELSDRVSAVFAELRASTASELAATHLIRAYELGLLDAWAAGETSSRRWVLGPEARCPEQRCESNERAGLVGVAEVFPSGHEAPPVHVGCTCTTVPGRKD